MSDSSGQYQSSQAYAQQVPSEESISPNSGSVNFSRTLIHLRGVTKAIGLSLQLSYTSGTQGSFGLPKGWGLGIPSTIPNKSLTAQGKTFVVDPNWSDATGWQSGLRYVNHHGMKFEEIIPAEPLPSGRPGDYSWRFRLADGSMEYFDSYGKLLEHDDIDNSSIYYAYVDPTAGPLTARVDYILDSWGQTVQFQYELGATLTVIAPDGGQTNVVFTTQGIKYIQDAMGHMTSFDYRVLNNVTLIDTISYPTGLQSRFDYIPLSARDRSGKTFYIPTCVQYVHLDTDGSIISNTRYVYGEQTTDANYTGASIGCRMGGPNDSLMDTGNSDYRYDIAMLRLDAKGNTLQMSRVYYNYLHLSMEEEHYNIDSTGNPQPGYRTVNTYDIPPDLHARATSYSQPIQVEQFHYSLSAADYKPLRRSSSTYDDFGCPLTTIEEMWDSVTNAYITQKSITSTYTATSWGGEILQTEIYTDHITRHQRLMTYGLDANKRHIASSSVQHQEGGTSGWKPWKMKSYIYDTSGRVTVETIGWSPGADIPQGSVQQYTYTQAYNFDATTGTFTISKTDPLGKTGSLSYQMKTTEGPLVKKTSPLGITERLSYDLLGRVIAVTDALGFTTKTTYLVGPGLTVQTVNALGYITKKTHDVLGRLVQVADSGNQSTTQADRVLSQTEYDMVSSIAKSTNELGLATTSSYDSFNRLTKKVDISGNVMTFVFDDDTLITEHRLNGDLRTTSIANGLSKPIKIINYADSAAASTYTLVLDTVYDGFGKVITTKHSQQSLNGSITTLLSQKDITYNVEDQPYLTTLSALPSTLTGNMDKVVREVTFDIFGNAVTYTKTVNYGDRRQYTNKGPVSLFDACNCLIKLTNQLGQVETNKFDADGRLTTMTRYDGTKFNNTYDALGHLLSSSTPDGTTAYEYLSNGRCAKITRGTATITRTYTPDGCIKSTVFPDGRSQTYDLDVHSRIIREVDAAGRATMNTFDAFGRLAAKQMGENKIEYQFGTVNHTQGIHIGSSITGTQPYTSEIAYDGFGRQNQVTDHNQAGSIILQSVYLLDSRGRLTSRQVRSQTLLQDPSVNNTRLFTYDGFGQLTSDSTGYPKFGLSAQNYLFSYDGNWNVIRKTINGSSSQFTYNAVDQRQDAGFVYDTNGRLSSDPIGRKYLYDSEDRLTSVISQNTTTYTYSPDSSLANSATANDNTVFYYNCGAVNSTLDTTSTGQSWTSYLLDPTRRVAAEKDGKESVVFLDSQNSVVMSLGATTSATYDYQAYGAPTDNIPTFGWQREFADSNNGLVYLRSRYYQPDHMAFITMDSSRGEENRYAYCNGDPINLADGIGHDTRSIIGAIAGFVVGLAVGVASGGLLAPAAVNICAVSLTTIGVAAAAVSGAAGTLAGDATTALIDGQPFTAARAGEDLLTGAIGGAVGAGSGGLATKAAMRMALDNGLSRSAILAVGYTTASTIGGAAGGFASSGTDALLHHESPFSMNTAFSTVMGFAGGALGAMAGNSLPTKGSYIPVELTEAETHLILKAAIPFNEQNIGNRDMFLMNTPAENARDWNAINTLTTDRNVLRTDPNGEEHFTIVAHGEGGRMYASTTYKGEVYYRPIDPTLFAKSVEGPSFSAARARDPNLQVKLISCNGGWSNAQKLANALQIPVWAAYKSVTVIEVPTWHLFNPKP